MTESKIEIFIGLAFICFSILLSGIGYMVYIEKSKIVAICGIPIVLLVFLGGAYVVVGGFRND